MCPVAGCEHSKLRNCFCCLMPFAAAGFSSSILELSSNSLDSSGFSLRKQFNSSFTAWTFAKCWIIEKSIAS